MRATTWMCAGTTGLWLPPPIVAEDKAELHRVRAAGLSEGENSTS